MNQRSATTIEVAPPGANSDAYYVGWLQDLSDLRMGGMVSDEDFAVSRAERLDTLFEEPGKPWLKWLLIGVPLSLVMSGVAMWLTGDQTMLFYGMGMSALCVLAALGAHSRVCAEHLSLDSRLDVLRRLLDRDLISASEFSEFEHRFLDTK